MEAFLLVPGDDAVGHGLGHALLLPFPERAVDVLAGGAGALGDGLEGLPEGGLVEGVSTLAVWAGSGTISCQPDRWVSWQSGWSRWKMPACWLQ